MKSLRYFIRKLGLAISRRIGFAVIDYRTGKLLSRALFIPWRGKIHIIGLEGDVRPIFQPQKRLTYWKQEIVFTTHPPVDFPKEKSNADQPKKDID